MAEIQSKINFCIRKRPHLNFYGSKQDATVDSSTDVKTPPKEKVSKPMIVKKIVELDSDDENIDLTNIGAPPKRSYKRKHSATVSRKRNDYSEDSDDSRCSPTKISRSIRNSKNKLPSVSSGIEKCENLDDARVALHGYTTSTLPGRQDELDQLTKFLNEHLECDESGTLYISGPPGTGKTACLTNILQQPEFKKGFVEVYVNCTTMKSAGSIYNRICQELHIKAKGCSEKAYLSAINNHLEKKHKMILLVLDEIDQLSNKNQSVLYTIFEWPSRTNSKLVLIGIANALDLTDRILPRLQARCELRPKLMHFAPYTKQQIIDIFSDRLKQDMKTDLFSPVAIQLLAGKVAAISGDVRRALDIGRRVVELASPQTRASRKSNTPSTNTVEMKQVMSVLNDVYGASQRLASDVDDNFPLQQKVLICSLLLILNKGKNKDVTVGKLHEIYTKVCKKRNLAAVDGTEFFGLCGLVETRGIIRLIGKKEPRMQKVSLQWNESEVTAALTDKRMISDIMNDVSCL